MIVCQERLEKQYKIKNHAGPYRPPCSIITSHAFRATFATRAVEKGVPVTTLQQLLGHSKIETTMKHYVHIPDESKVRAMQILNEEENCEMPDPAVPEEKKA